MRLNWKKEDLKKNIWNLLSMYSLSNNHLLNSSSDFLVFSVEFSNFSIKSISDAFEHKHTSERYAEHRWRWYFWQCQNVTHFPSRNWFHVSIFVLPCAKIHCMWQIENLLKYKYIKTGNSRWNVVCQLS